MRNGVCELDMCHKLVGPSGRNSVLVTLGFQNPIWTMNTFLLPQVELLYKGLESVSLDTIKSLNKYKQNLST